jgi:transposase-like protein
VLTDACGQVEIALPRDRDETFEPQNVRMRQRRLPDVDGVVHCHACGKVDHR